MNFLEKGLCKQSETALHTHDSLCFKRCRRKWWLSSPFSKHLQPKASVIGTNPHLWFGSAIHWAMEDYHGLNKFGNPMEAFTAYVEAFDPVELPANSDELIPLGMQMLEYYTEWEAEHAKWKTVWLNGVPLVEVKFSLVVQELCYYEYDGDRYFALTGDASNGGWVGKTTGQLMSTEELNNIEAPYHQVVFHGTMDRVVEDEHGHWWVLDYKTAKAVDTGKLSLDPQISKYCWAAEQLSLIHI